MMRGNIYGQFVCAAVLLAAPLPGQIARTRTNAARSPYTAQYKLTHIQKLADGNLISNESSETLAADSQGRHLTATTETPLSGDQKPRTRVMVFDPVARVHVDWTSPGERALVIAMPEPGPPRNCSPNATRRDGVTLGTAPAMPRPVNEDLGTQTFHGIEARGRRTITTIPAGEIGNQAPLVRTSERWTAIDPALGGLTISETSDDPRSGTRTRELIDVDQREPDAAIFQPPAGYEIVNRSATSTSCGSESALAKQE